MSAIERLARAMMASQMAFDSRGLRVNLCDYGDKDDVRAKMLYLAASLQVGNLHLGEALRPSKHAEANTAHNLGLLAELLSAWLNYEHEIEERGKPDVG